MDADLRQVPKNLASGTVNPFTVTKAVDFSDQEIGDFWVDFDKGAGLSILAKPQSPVAMFITGGKGSGKTHLMRYLSSSNQLLRSGESGASVLTRDRYLGIYVRFSGLNGPRFSGKSQTDDQWIYVFAYYTELWLGKLMFEVIQQVLAHSPEQLRALDEAAAQLNELFTAEPNPRISCWSDVTRYLELKLREVDHAVNNCGLTGRLNLEICVNRGALIFHAPQRLAASMPVLGQIQFLYLLDEFEMLNVDQQKYINTLVREKERPTAFKVGGRSYGIRTYATLSADEELREGSEFEQLPLDELLRRSKKYPEFCRKMVRRRLTEGLEVHESAWSQDGNSLDEQFVSLSNDRLLLDETRFVVKKYEGQERPYFKRLRSQLESGLTSDRSPGITERANIDRVIDSLRYPQAPLVEKANILLLYRSWARGRNLLDEAARISSLREFYIANSEQSGEYRSLLEKFKFDLFAQLLRDCDQKQRYCGLSTFIQMSDGLPRNLLVILKHIYSWAEFSGETPFRGQKISIEAQQRGVSDATEWFLQDARIPGPLGTRVHEGIRRLAELFREIRYSDKPSECSLVAFSVNRLALDATTLELIDLASKWALLVRVSGGQKDRNSKRIDDKFQLNPMLAPLWDLPVSRRGAMALMPGEVEAIFAPREDHEFRDVLRRRLSGMRAPFSSDDLAQGGLFGSS